MSRWIVYALVTATAVLVYAYFPMWWTAPPTVLYISVMVKLAQGIE